MRVFIGAQEYRDFGMEVRAGDTHLVFNARVNHFPRLPVGTHNVRIVFGSSNRGRAGDAEWRGKVSVNEPDVYLTLPTALDPRDDEGFRWTVQREGYAALYLTSFRGLALHMFTDVEVCVVWVIGGPFIIKTPIGLVDGSSIGDCLRAARALATTFVDRVSAWTAGPPLESPERRSRWEFGDDL